jgi:micrococcal nuclease
MVVALLAGCGGEEPCGPSSGVVTRVIDGDTVEIESGERIRYLMIDTPEITGGAPDCFGPEASQFNAELVLGREVSLAYDVECLDRYGRHLAYVSVGDREVNALLVERGYACVLYIPPNGEDRRAEFEALEMTAKAQARGMWGECEEVTCD